MIVWVWYIYYFTGNMNLLVLITTLLLGNTTVKIEKHNLESSSFLEQIWQRNSEELRFREQWQQWRQYKKNYGKFYQNYEEEYRRKNIFIENSILIENHNLLYNEGKTTYELGHNDFSDLTHEEFLEQYTTFDQSTANFEENAEPTVRYDPTLRDDPTVRNEPTVRHEPTVRNEPTVRQEPTVRYESYGSSEKRLHVDYLDYIPPANVWLPLSVDWRRLGAVTRVKNQGKCKASWLFSATGALEGQVFRSTGNLTALSEQNILDCSNKYGNDGCHNGTVFNSFKYVLLNEGIDTNTTYPWYEGKSWFCHYKQYQSNPQVRQIVKLQKGNESSLQAAVATVGPISIGVDARNRKFQFYKNGIYNDLTCTNYNLTINMLAVGYGRGYWIVKNSFGENWGSRGYILMSKDRRNQCGIATRALFPLV